MDNKKKRRVVKAVTDGVVVDLDKKQSRAYSHVEIIEVDDDGDVFEELGMRRMQI